MPTKDSLLSLSAVELRRRIGSKEISPVELLEACLARIEAINPAVNDPTKINQTRVQSAVDAWNNYQDQIIPNITGEKPRPIKKR